MSTLTLAQTQQILAARETSTPLPDRVMVVSTLMVTEEVTMVVGVGVDVSV